VRVTAGGGDQLHGFGETGIVDVADGGRGPVPGDCNGQGLADARSCAGDHDDLAGEGVVHRDTSSMTEIVRSTE
jgi:hypothetical protein